MKKIPAADKSEFFMRMVYLVGQQSKDPSTKIGAVLVRGDTVISTGWNGFPRKVVDLEELYINKAEKYPRIVHSEMNTLLLAARNGISTDGATLFVNCHPCSDCCKALIQAGVKKIITHKQWPICNMAAHWDKSFEISNQMIKESGIVIEEFDKELGLETLISGKLVKV